MRPVAMLKIASLVVLVAPLVPAQLLFIRLRSPLAGRQASFVLRMACRILGVRVRVEGAPRRGGVLLVGNHVSWLDIIVLGGLMPLCFVAKSEVAGWPVFGLLAKLKRCVFIERDRRLQSGEQAETIAGRLAAGEAVVLFPEGSTGDSVRLLPFRSSLLGATRLAEAVAVQPFAIRYTHRSGLRIGRIERPSIIWVGDMELLPHFKAILEGGPIDVVVRFGETRKGGAGVDRKALTRDLEADVRFLLRG